MRKMISLSDPHRVLRRLIYDSSLHRRLRKQWALVVAAGGVNCADCGDPITPGTPWHLGHVPGDPYTYRGPEHAECNCATNRARPRSRRW